MLMATAFGFYTFHPVTLKLTAVDDVSLSLTDFDSPAPEISSATFWSPVNSTQ